MFCSAPPVDEEWAPPVNSKTDTQVEMLLRIMAKHPLLHRLSRDQQFLLVDAFEERFCEAGDVLCRPGDHIGFAYFVEAGSLDVMPESGKGAHALGPDYACDECLLYPCRARSTVRASCDTNTWMLDADVYRRTLRETAAKEAAVVGAHLASSDLFHWLDDAQREAVLPACDIVDFDAGECVWPAEGDDEACALIVVEVSPPPPPRAAPPLTGGCRMQGALGEERPGGEQGEEFTPPAAAGRRLFFPVRRRVSGSPLPSAGD